MLREDPTSSELMDRLKKLPRALQNVKFSFDLSLLAISKRNLMPKQEFDDINF